MHKGRTQPRTLLEAIFVDRALADQMSSQLTTFPPHCVELKSKLGRVPKWESRRLLGLIHAHSFAADRPRDIRTKPRSGIGVRPTPSNILNRTHAT